MLLLFFKMYLSGIAPCKNHWVFVLKLFSFIRRSDYIFVLQIKLQLSLHRWQKFSLSIMETLRNKRKLAAVSRETSESTRNSRAQNAIDPEMAQKYISQVSEEIGGRVIKKLLKEFSRTESRILGALWKLDEFLLNPQVRTCSVAVPGTSKISNSGNREPFGDRSLDDPCPEVRFSSHHSGKLNSPDVEEYPHKKHSWRKFSESRVVALIFKVSITDALMVFFWIVQMIVYSSLIFCSLSPFLCLLRPAIVH